MKRSLCLALLPLLAAPAPLVSAASRLIGWIKRDLFVTPEEMRALMADLLVTDSPPAGPTRLTEWARANAQGLGRRYHSELARRRENRPRRREVRKGIPVQ